MTAWELSELDARIRGRAGPAEVELKVSELEAKVKDLEWKSEMDRLLAAQPSQESTQPSQKPATAPKADGRVLQIFHGDGGRGKPDRRQND